MSDSVQNVAIILSAQDKASAIFGGIADKLKGLGLVGDDSAKKIEGMGTSSDNAGKKMQLMGAIAAGAVVAGVAVIGAESLKAAAHFQTLTTTLVTTAGESEKNISKVRDGILTLSTQTGTSADKMSAAMYIIESAGYHAADGLTILKAAAQGAKAENADLGKVADAVTSSLRDYHLPATKAADVTSQLVAAVGAGKSNFEQFTGALHSVLPVASAMHEPLSDILGSLASMTVHGMSADQATDNLSHTLLKMQSPTSQMTAELAQLGIKSSDLSDMVGKKGLSQTLEYISQTIFDKVGPAGKVMLNAFNGNKIQAADMMSMISAMPPQLQAMAKSWQTGAMSAGDFKATIKELPTDQANLMTQFVGLASKATGFSGALKSGINTSQSYSQALQAATGDSTTMKTALMLTGENAKYTADAVKAVGKAHAEAGNNVAGWAYIQKNFNQQQQQAKEALKNTSIAIGSALLPVATQLMGLITKIVTPVAAWIEQHKQLATIIMASIGGFALLTATLLTMSFAFGKIKDAFSFLSVFKKGTDDVGKFGKVVDDVGKSAKGISGVAADTGKGIGGFIKGVLKPLGSTEVLKGAASAALIGVAIFMLAIGINQASKDKINIANLAILMGATVVIGLIMALMSTFASYAIIGAIASAVIGGGLYVAALGISKASDLSKNISETNLLKLSGALASVSAILAIIMPMAAFGAIGSILSAIISEGLVIAAEGLKRASMLAASISPKSLDALFAVIKKLGQLNAGSLMNDLLNMVKTAAMTKMATEIGETAATLNKVQVVKESVIDNVKNVLEKMGTLNAGNLFKDWGTSQATGDIAGTAKNIVSISTDLGNVKTVDSTKMDTISAMIKAAGNIDAGNFIAKWGQKQASGNLASTAKNVLNISIDLGKVQTVDPTKMKKIQTMIENAGGIKFGGFWSNWGTSNSSNKLKDSINNIVQISVDVGKIKTVTPAEIANLGNIQKFIDKAGGLKFKVTQVTGADLAAMTNQGVLLASNFVDGVKHLFSMAENAGHQLQSSLWHGVQGHMKDENNQGRSMAQQFIDGLKSQDGDAGNAGHGIQSAFWNGIQSHFADEHSQGAFLAKSVIDGIYSVQNQWWGAGDSVAQGFAGGITRNMGLINTAVGKLSSTAIGKLKSLLDIHSPSKVFDDIGKNVSAGMAQGITSSSKSVGEATRSIAPSISMSGNTIASGTMTNPRQSTSAAVTGSNSGNGNAAATQHVTINVNVGAYAGQPGEIDKLGTVLWQSFQRIARQHGAANSLPNIGVRPS